MRVHHLNCGSMTLTGAPLVCHVLLVETSNGLVLVDAGFGLRDIAEPKQRIGMFRHLGKPVLAEHETALRQVERLGFRRDDVRHIVLTHLDLDHVGGIADFPDAKVHVTSAEALGAMHAPSRRERLRFRPAQWAHGPKLVEHDPEGEMWRGFAAAKPLEEISAGIVLISLAGHSRGHAAVGVDAGDHWVLHAGDAFYHPGTLDGHARIPVGLRVLETLIAYDLKKVRANHERLAELFRRGEPDLQIICAHDPTLYEQSLRGHSR